MNKKTKEIPFLSFWTQIETCNGASPFTAMFECCQEIRFLLNAHWPLRGAERLRWQRLLPLESRSSNPCHRVTHREFLQVSVAQIGRKLLAEHWDIIIYLPGSVCVCVSVWWSYFSGCVGLSSVSMYLCARGRLNV